MLSFPFLLPQVFHRAASHDEAKLAEEGGTGGKAGAGVEFFEAFAGVVTECFEQMVHPVDSKPSVEIVFRLTVDRC